jgi:hypothetical protein
MRWRYLIGYIMLIAVVVWGCAGCADRERTNCIRTKNKALTLSTDMQIGGGRCG